MKSIVFFSLVALLLSSCSPIKSSPEEEHHKVELTLHEVQTNLDDSRHDLHCFRSELQILDSKVRKIESMLSTLQSSVAQRGMQKLDHVEASTKELEKKIQQLAKKQESMQGDLRKLAGHADQTSDQLAQFHSHISNLEKESLTKFQDLEQLHRMLTHLTQELDPAQTVYTVRSGDSLGKIAKKYGVTLKELKKINQLDRDLIVAGQQLKIPKK